MDSHLRKDYAYSRGHGFPTAIHDEKQNMTPIRSLLRLNQAWITRLCRNIINSQEIRPLSLDCWKVSICHQPYIAEHSSPQVEQIHLGQCCLGELNA